VIQKYDNICNESGEYHPSAILICPPNGPVHSLPMTIVAHQRNRYSVVSHHGVRYMKQHRVGAKKKEAARTRYTMSAM
jgi:hypothetical protein